MSEPTAIDLPVGLRWIKLVYRLGQLVTDSTVDADPHPDLLPKGGTLTLTASPDVVRIQEADGRWRSVDIAGRTYTIRSDGELVDGEGRVGVWIPDPASLLVEPQGYAITAVVKPTTGKERRVTIGGSTVLPDVVDLVAISSVGSVSPSVTASFDARLYTLEQGSGEVDVGQAVEDYLVANPPAGGGGVDLVAGAVTLDATGAPVREFYATGSATIDGVSFPAGAVVVFRREPSGEWGYKAVGDWTPSGTAPTPVSAAPPVFTDMSGTASDTYTIPTKAGVRYLVGGSVRAAGTYPGSGTVTITAEATAGYTLTGTASWTHTFSTATDPIPVTATAPTWVDDTTLGGGTWTTPTITGVTYSPASGTATPGQAVTVTATANSGYVLSGTGSWSHTFPTAAEGGFDTLEEAILSLSPAGYWKLDETSGTTAADSSGNGRDGTYEGSFALAGQDGFATFTNGCVSLGDDDDWSMTSASGFTVFALTRTSGTHTNHRAILTKGHAGQYEWSTQVVANSANLGSHVWGSPTAAATLMGWTTTLSAHTHDEWHAVAVAFPLPAQGAHTDHYIDTDVALGKVSDNMQPGVYVNGTAAMAIGARRASASSRENQMVGAIGHAAVFRTKLSAAQVGVLVSAARTEGLIP